MASINKLQPGQTVWEVRRQRMGNTTIRYGALYRIRIISVDVEQRTVMASWNSNPAQKFYERDIAKWKVKKPEPKGEIFGQPTY